MKLKIAILPGDGIGPEIIEQAMKVVKAVATKFNYELEYEYGLTGATAIDQVCVTTNAADAVTTPSS